MSVAQRSRPTTNRLSSPASLRAAPYRRVSSDEQIEGYSLDAQTRAVRQYCESHGWAIVHEYSDEGKSARTDDLAKRPAFGQMLADAEAGLFDVIVVHKLDRFARNLRVTLETLERLDRAGVAFVSISEQMDFTSPIGKVILATLAAFAQYYSDNLSWETKKGKHERKAQGLYNGVLPFGVKRNKDVRVPVPDPESYPGLLLAMQTAAQGKSDRDVADVLNEAGYRSTGNRGHNPFTKDTVRPILTNRFYLGELPDGAGGWIKGAHAPMLDDDLFEQVKQVRAANRTAIATVAHSMRRYALSGLAVCGHCGGRLHFQTDRYEQSRVFCYQGKQATATACAQRSHKLAPIEAQLGAYLATFHLDDETVAEIITLYERSRDERDDSERRRREIESRLARIAELYKWGDLTRDAYQSERDQLQGELGGLKRTTSISDLLTRTAAFLRDLPTTWEAATSAQRNALAGLVFQSVEIKDDRVIAVVVNEDFVPYFAAFEQHDAPANMPGRQGLGEKYQPGGSDGIRTRDLSLDRAAC